MIASQFQVNRLQAVRRNRKTALKAILLAATVIVASFVVAFFIIPHPSSLTLQNCVWLTPSSMGLELMNTPSLWESTVIRLENANIHCIIVWAGWWNPDHTIQYADSPNVWKQFISTVKATDPDFKVLALVGTDQGIDISTSANRTLMIKSVKQLLSSAPFSGWNDDLETFIGSNQDLIAYWQGVASMVKGMGLIATVDTGVGAWSYSIEEVYPYLTNFNYIIPMFYSTIAYSNAADYWNSILSNSPVPVIMGLAIDPPANGNLSMSQQLTWIDGQSHKNLAGFSIWVYDYWSDADFAAWNNWAINKTLGYA